MLPESYFDGSRLKAYLAMLKELEESSKKELQDRENDSAVISVVLKETEVVPPTQLPVTVIEEKEDELFVCVPDETMVVEVKIEPSLEYKEVKDDTPVVVKKMELDRPRKVTVRGSNCSKMITVASHLFVVFSLETGKVENFMVCEKENRKFSLCDLGFSSIANSLRERICTKMRFPGTEFSGLTRAKLPELKKRRYILAEKLDGVRYILLVIRGIPYFLNRNGRVYMENVIRFDCEDFIVDGEMVNGMFIVFDVLFENNRNLMFEPFVNRVRSIHDIVDRVNQKDLFNSQRFYPMQDVYKVAYKALEGLVFLPMDLTYQIGFSDKVFKFKPGFDTVDVKVIQERNKCVYKSVLYLQSGHHRLIYFDDATGMEHKVGKIVEVAYVNDKWSYIRDRPDKIMPNSVATVTEVQREVRNPLTKEDLVGFIIK